MRDITSTLRSSRRHRTNPFKLLCLLLYGSYSWATWNGLSVTFHNTEMLRVLRVPVDRLKEYCLWLHFHNYIDEVEFRRGYTTVTVKVPQNLNLGT